MGDRRRFEILSDFIARNFNPCSVADVAGGTGMLSYHLTTKGFDCTVIDPRKSDLPKDYRTKARRQGIQIKRRRTEFLHSMAKEFDLVVGLHPDQATENICIAGLKKKCVIVPCCYYWSGKKLTDSPNDMADKICKFFDVKGLDYWRTCLPIQGKNLVIVRK